MSLVVWYSKRSLGMLKSRSVRRSPYWRRALHMGAGCALRSSTRSYCGRYRKGKPALRDHSEALAGLADPF